MVSISPSFLETRHSFESGKATKDLGTCKESQGATDSLIGVVSAREVADVIHTAKATLATTNGISGNGGLNSDIFSLN